MRGRRNTRPGRTVRLRNTPADAGTTGDGTGSGRGQGEHPRGCGDDRTGSGVTPSPSGTPPRMRGRHEMIQRAGWAEGNTPADAGTTRCGRRPWGRGAEHPRGCGDDMPSAEEVAGAIGTPPRMRGRRCGRRCRSWLRRNTPADAGTTPTHAPSGTSSTGTPPRMRGRLKELVDGLVDGGNTPADAGTTTSLPRSRRRRTEHPRGCGDDSVPCTLTRTTDGTPPRMRGRLAAKEAGDIG